MEFNVNTQNRSKQILAMYGIYTDKLQKSQVEAQQSAQNELQKSEQAQAVQEQAAEVATVADDLNKGQEQQSLNTQDDKNDFTKSLEALMAPITFD